MGKRNHGTRKRSAQLSPTGRTLACHPVSTRELRPTTAVATNFGVSASGTADAGSQGGRVISKPKAMKKDGDGDGHPTSFVRPSQRQVLLDAAKTSLENTKALEVMLHAHSHQRTTAAGALLTRQLRGRAHGCRVVFHSKLDQPTTLTFTDIDTFPEVINARAKARTIIPFSATPSPFDRVGVFSSTISAAILMFAICRQSLVDVYTAPPHPVCAITGEKAKYIDPLTKQPYATLAAFKELRRRFNAANAL